MRRMIPTKKIEILDEMNYDSATNKIEVGGNLEVDGNIASNSKITADEIVENMVGYSFDTSLATADKGDIEYIYVGVVKNGNKLTIVCAFNFTKLTGATGSLILGRVMIPDDVMAKIYPSISYSVDLKEVPALPNTWSAVKVFGGYTKYDSHSLNPTIADVSALTAETQYYIRLECTILLSDNLAPEEP